MAISRIGGTTGGTANGGAITLTLPGSMNVDDLIIVAFGAGDDDFTQPTLAMTTAGYVELTTTTLSADGGTVGDANLAVFYKWHNGSDTTAVCAASGTGTDSSTCAALQVFRGVAKDGLPGGIGPLEIAIQVASGTTGGDPDPPQVSGFTEATSAIVIAGMTSKATAPMTLTAPTNYTTNALTGTGTDAFSGSVMLAYRLTGAADPENPGIIVDNGTGGAKAAATLVLKEAVAATDLVIGAANIAVHSDAVTLSPHLVIGAANIAVHSDNVVLVPNLIIGEANLAVHADNVVLTTGDPPADLVIPDVNVGVHSDNLTLATSISLAIGEANVAVHSDNVVLVPNLIIGESNLGVHSDNVVLEAFAPPGQNSITPEGTLLLTHEWQAVPLNAYSWDNSAGILSRISGRVQVRKTTRDTTRGRIAVEAYVDDILVLEGNFLWPSDWKHTPSVTYPVSGWFDLSRVGVDSDVWYAVDGDHTFSVQARVMDGTPGVLYLDIELVGQSLEVV